MSTTTNNKDTNKKATAKCTWKIEKFSTQNTAKISPKLILPDHNKYYLLLSPKGEIRHLPNFMAIYLLKSESFSMFEKPGHVSYRISLLDGLQNRCFTKEFTAEFAPGIKYDPIHSGLYLIGRNYILNETNGLLKNDTLSIYFEVSQLDDNGEKFDIVKCEKSCLKLTKDFTNLLEDSSQHSDVLFVIGKDEKKKEFRLHKNILASRSVVFKAMFSNDCVEKRENRVEISDLTVPAFEQMIRYIYTGKTGEGLRQCAAELFVAADKYQLDILKNIAMQEVISSLTPECVSGVLVLADMHSAEKLKANCIQFISQNADQVIGTEGWKKFVEPRVDLMGNLYRDLATFWKVDKQK